MVVMVELTRVKGIWDDTRWKAYRGGATQDKRMRSNGRRGDVWWSVDGRRGDVWWSVDGRRGDVWWSVDGKRDEVW